jgi:hypothetical protein
VAGYDRAMARSSGRLLALLVALATGGCGGEGTPTPCRATAGFCQCGPDSAPGNVVACSVSSLGGVGLCCRGQQSCHCDKLVCVDAGDECSCGPASVLQAAGGPALSACQARPGQICCFSSGDLFCRCRPSDHCLASEHMVPSCTPAVAECAPGFDSVSSCR